MRSWGSWSEGCVVAMPEAQKGILGSGTSPPEAGVTVLLAPLPLSALRPLRGRARGV